MESMAWDSSTGDFRHWHVHATLPVTTQCYYTELHSTGKEGSGNVQLAQLAKFITDWTV